jgi:peptidoglycan hydrolase-like protein with peptidoglycan-binding domain
MDLRHRDLKQTLTGDDVRLLHAELTSLGHPIPPAESEACTFDTYTHSAVQAFQKNHGLPVTGIVDAATAKAMTNAIHAITYSVKGTVTSPDRAALGSLRVQIVDKNVGGDVPLAETTTDGNGRYRTTFVASSLLQRKKASADLQAGVYADKTLLAVSAVRYDATRAETLDVALPAGASALPSEHEALTAALAAHYGGKLGDIKEDAQQQDISYLANKSGWDARAVAYASLADQLGRAHVDASGKPAIDPAFYYALLRAGVPGSPDALYQAAPQTVSAIWRNAVAEGVVPQALAAAIPAAQQAFQGLSAAAMLDARAVTGASSMREMLAPVLADDKQTAQFAGLLAQYRTDMPGFWSAVGKAFGAETATRLQVDGQLGYLTLNNVPLIQKVRGALPALAAPLDLVAAGYYRAASWATLLGNTIPAPDSIPGASADEKRANYAELLAAQVRLSFPTAVAGDMVRVGMFPLNMQDVSGDVQAFLATHQAEFAIDQESVDRYLGRKDLAGKVSPEVRVEVKRLQRVRQITPSDAAMSALLMAKVDSAYQIARYQPEAFVAAFEDKVGGEADARMIHARATQIHSVSLNVVLSYLAQRRGLSLGSSSDSTFVAGAPAPVPAPAEALVTATLENLFGSMDFCACDQCRSMLSPAAYLVDLLRFLDSPADDPSSPFAALIARRPDIPYLPLTCANTNKALPYIDLVNETLEYWVAEYPPVGPGQVSPPPSLGGYQGHDTADTTTSADLLATPQFVSSRAYAVLQAASFPQPLPFSRSLELLRRLFRTFGVPLPRAMEVLRVDDALTGAGESPQSTAYGWRDILLEEIGVSRDEDALLTSADAAPPSLATLYGQPGVVTDALANAKSLTQSLGISYADLVAIVQTRFVNPYASLIPSLQRLRVSFATMAQLMGRTISGDAFRAMLPADLDLTPYGGDVAAWVTDPARYAQIMGLILISNPGGDDPCSLEHLELRYSDPDPSANQVQAGDYVRLARFVRLWKKLGWTIDQTDKAIAALSPVAAPPAAGGPTPAPFDPVFLPRLGVVVRAVELLGLDVDADLPGLLTCFAPIDAGGPTSTYARMFLQSSTTLDPAFAVDASGDVFVSGTEPLWAHAETLRSAFNLTGDEFALIFGELGFATPQPAAVPPLPGTPLILVNISAVYRLVWLSRKLGLSVRDFLALLRFSGLSGLDPFAPPDPPNPAILWFIAFVQALQARSLDPVQALYLMWNQDLSGDSAPSPADIAQLARRLRSDLTQIDGDYDVQVDPTSQIARARMAAVYGQDATDFFFSLVNRTFSVTTAPGAYSSSAGVLPPSMLAAATDRGTGKIRLGYDDFAKTLTYVGVLDDPTVATLVGAAGGDAPLAAAIRALSTLTQSALGQFFSQYPDLQSIYQGPRDPSTLLRSLLQDLKAQRKLQQALSDITSAAGTAPSFARRLLTDASVLHSITTPPGNAALPAIVDVVGADQSAQTVLGDPRPAVTVAGIGDPGLAGQFYWAASVPAGNPPDLSLDAVPVAVPAGAPPGRPISGVWTGYLEARASGFYRLTIQTDGGAGVALWWEGQPATMQPVPNIPGAWTNQAVIGPLVEGNLYSVTVQVQAFAGALALKWQAAGAGVEVIPARYLYSSTLVERLRATYVRFLKASALATALKLSANEIAYLAQQRADQIAGDGWLNALSVATPPPAASFPALRGALSTLLDFARIKAALSPNDERLLSLLQSPTADAATALTGWDIAAVVALLTRWSLGQDARTLGDFRAFRRVHDAYAMAKKMGISCQALLDATTNNPDPSPADGTPPSTFPTTDNLRAALRARYAAADWLDVVKPINDEMRRLQRDALVAYVLQSMRLNPPVFPDRTRWVVDTPERLYEYFLMDVQMDPCMQTSRVRHALSAVQLFADRCQMNLEPGVAPSAIDPAKWAWMKRYRVWEANREVFLWPENWLDPELRDGQTPLFKQALSTLLQGDITEDTAAATLLDYLSSLETIAKLDPCGVYYDEAPPANQGSGPVAHVIARTPGAQRQYYYRRREQQQWTPWEKIPLDIEDNPVLPVVWRGRLLLFWLRILGSTPSTPSGVNVSTGAAGSDIVNSVVAQQSQSAAVAYSAMLCFSEYYNGKWTPTKTSDPNNTLPLGDFSPPQEFVRSTLALHSAPDDSANTLTISISRSRQSFLLYNTHAAPVIQDTSAFQQRVDILTAPDLDITYADESYTSFFDRDVLRAPLEAGTVQPRQPLADPWVAPFFFWDSHAAFYVTTSAQQASSAQWSGYVVPMSPVLYPTRVPATVILLNNQRTPGALVPRGGPGDPAVRAAAAGTSIRYLLPGAGTARVGGLTVDVLGSQFAAPALSTEFAR